MRSLVRVDTTHHGIARCTMTALFVACSMVACADQPEDDDAVAASEQSITGTWDMWRTVAQGVAVPGSTVAAIPIGGTVYSVFTNAVGIFTINGSPQLGYPSWVPVRSVLVAPNTSITALPIGNGRAALFPVNSDGFVIPLIGSTQTGWAEFDHVGTRAARPGTTVAAIANGGGQFTLFMIGADDAIYYSVWNNITLREWTRVGTGLARPGTSVTAVPTGNGLIALFVIGTDSHIFTTTGNPTTNMWDPWPIVFDPAGPPVVANANTTRVTVIPDTFGKFTLFYVGTAGGIFPVTGSTPTGWIAYPALAGAARSDSTITAVLTADGHFELFVIGTDSQVYTNIGTPTTPWFGWELVPGISALAGSSVTAARVGGSFYLWLPDATGEIRNTFGHY